ncbi:MAG TPA: hypothetical protein ENF47_03010 [Thermoprotei archaeon]|nr:hypothetical protein [Thermoprotei archaeon]
MYRRGYRAERKVFKYLEKRGFYVVRSARSKGLFDLIAIRKIRGKTIVLGIQVKLKEYLVKRDIAYTDMFHRLKDAYEQYGIIPLYATAYRKIRFYTYEGFEIELDKLLDLLGGEDG